MMMSKRSKVNALDQLRIAVPKLADEARVRAEEFEQSRKISLDFVSKLKAAGVYRILVSEEQGGLGGSLIDWFDMVTSLAEADASTGWTCAHGAVTNALVANIADQKFVDSLFSDPNASTAWSNLPRVETKEVSGGLRITGRWAFGTGCTAATYVGGMLPLPKKSDDGEDRVVVALAPIEQVTIDETWNPIGLAGTGSHDVVFNDVFVPWLHIFDWPDSKLTYSYPTAIFANSRWFISICAGATHLGLARRAIDEARKELGAKKDRITQEPLIANPAILVPLEEAEGLYFACRAGMEKALKEVWESALQGKPSNQTLDLRITLAAVTAVHQCTAIVRSVYDISGASVISRRGVLQRLYRDASCLTHHTAVNRKTVEAIGKIRNGLMPMSNLD
jgi:alkylation response protein AidB-like acyl-CoA dehydrogenase